MVSSAAVNQVVLSLYREGRDVLLHHFQDWALEQVRILIPFDSAWWGNAANEPIKIHWLHLLNCEPSIMEVYPPYIGQDFFRAKLMANPGTAVNMSDLISREEFVKTEMYQVVATRYKIEWSLGTLLNDPVSASLAEFITLWRHDPLRPFSEGERQTKELLMPHLVEAFRAVRLRHFLKDRDTRLKSWALADNEGFIREITPAFDACLRANWPRWSGSMLPASVAQCVVESRAYESRSLNIDLRQSENLRFLEVRPKTSMDKLTARESEIISRYASGETYSGIASALALAPTTVRNHIANCFRKLGVKNKAELVRRLNPQITRRNA